MRLSCALERGSTAESLLTEQSSLLSESGLLWFFPDQRESLLTPSTLRDRARQPLGQNINTKAQGTRERVHCYTEQEHGELDSVSSQCIPYFRLSSQTG